MSAPDPSSSSSAAVDPDPPLSSSSSPSLTTITALDSELSTLSSAQPDMSLLSGQVEEREGEGEVSKDHAGIVHDLAPVHNILVQLASTLQVKVDLATRELQEIRTKLAREMQKTSDSLSSLGEVKLPSGFPASLSSSSMLLPDFPASETILAIHHYRDQAVSALHNQVEVLSTLPRDTKPRHPVEDFNTASDGLDSSFQQLRGWLDQVGQTARKLQNCDGETNTLRRFSSERCRDIDLLEREAVLKKMGELSVRNCSLQSRKPVRSLGHTLDLQEIMLLAKNAKSLVYEVSLQMLKIVDLVKGEEIAATTTYHRLTKENSELLRRYCFYLKLKIQQL
eukprot:GFUD01017025.1.p1 GENE.GFUD01017025.1~~GFUD01017025.1.p1  ORF type:complete len:338 (-),score=151.28 GFUD01017025.1:1252-2265(-)